MSLISVPSDGEGMPFDGDILGRLRQMGAHILGERLSWKTVLNEIRDGDGDHDLLILQGEFLSLWREYTMMGCPYRQMMHSPKCCILTIN